MYCLCVVTCTCIYTYSYSVWIVCPRLVCGYTAKVHSLCAVFSLSFQMYGTALFSISMQIYCALCIVCVDLSIVYMYVHVVLNANIPHVHTCIYMYICAYMYIHTYTSTCTYMYISYCIVYTYTCMYIRSIQVYKLLYYRWTNTYIANCHAVAMNIVILSQYGPPLVGMEWLIQAHNEGSL